MQPLISVIIPVYKVEAYLTACVESVLAQTYPNIEIILVDDGSPDGCPAICDAFAARDSRIRVLHKENGGLSSARNAGIDMAGGDYLALLDSDDLWSPRFLERLFRAIQETEADFAVCLFQSFQNEQEIRNAIAAKTLCFSQADAFECLFDHRNENMVVAPNKLYVRKLFDGADQKLRYPVGKLHEDEAVIHEIIGAAEKVAWVEEAHYYYRQSPGSITTSRFTLKRLDETFAKEQRIAYFEGRGMQALADRTKIVYLSNLMRLYRTVQAELEDKEAAAQACSGLYQKFCRYYSGTLMNRASRCMRLRCILFKLFPCVYSRMDYVRLKRKGIQ